MSNPDKSLREKSKKKPAPNPPPESTNLNTNVAPSHIRSVSTNPQSIVQSTVKVSPAATTTTKSTKSTKSTTSTSGTPTPAEPDILCKAVRDMGYSANAQKQIGEGAFSKVFRARSVRIPNRDIAVKIVRLNDPNIPQAWKDYSMKRELKILKCVKHPNLITVYDVVKTRTRVFIFMDLAATSVSSHLEATEEPASEQTARNWFWGICNAIAYLHQTGIAHRDLKNDNILIDSNGQTKLTDFGFACFTFNRRTKTDIPSYTVCGTKAYVAPEVLNPPYNPKMADVWSVGICLFECVTLLLPFKDDLSTTSFLQAQTERGLEIPKSFQLSLDPQLQDLLKKMVEPDFNKRIRSEAVLIHPWMRKPRR